MRNKRLFGPCESRSLSCALDSNEVVVKPVVLSIGQGDKNSTRQHLTKTPSPSFTPVFMMNSNQADFRVRTWELCRDYLQGIWTKISPEQIIISQISGGLSNLIYYCSLPEGMEPERQEPFEVLLRIYGRNLKSNLTVDNVVFSLLSERELGPHLYGVFAGGRLEEYIPAQSMCQNQVRDPVYSLAIARKVSRIHMMEMPVKKDGTKIRQLMQSYLEQLEDFSLEEIVDPYEREVACKVVSHNFTAEVEWFWSMITQFNSPIVFCHNDLTGGNILVRDEKVGSRDDQIVLIDYEYAAYGHRGFDLANHFCEWMYDYTNKEYPHYFVLPDKFASPEAQSRFFREYLSHQDEIKSSHKKEPSKRNEDKTSSSQLLEYRTESLFHEVRHFLLGPHLLWTLWGIIHSTDKDIKFGYMHYANTRLNQYLELKSELGFK
eukprot:TRINITY_DN5121_c0_g1_i1.p1 TRINITY_DN5121_c0_g1~~TRINITY_DN5121_c0_g1_i1.p1  ORF type:complete len:433 (+),score=60.04 TRINITY_DN5121_c0_g1_i1:142-1440(+)